MKFVSKRYLKTKQSKLAWSGFWTVFLAIFSITWLYRAFDTGSSWDYLITLFGALSAVSFAIDVKETVLPSKGVKQAK